MTKSPRLGSLPVSTLNATPSSQLTPGSNPLFLEAVLSASRPLSSLPPICKELGESLRDPISPAIATILPTPTPAEPATLSQPPFSSLSLPPSRQCPSTAMPFVLRQLPSKVNAFSISRPLSPSKASSSSPGCLRTTSSIPTSQFVTILKRFSSQQKTGQRIVNRWKIYRQRAKSRSSHSLGDLMASLEHWG